MRFFFNTVIDFCIKAIVALCIALIVFGLTTRRLLPYVALAGVLLFAVRLKIVQRVVRRLLDYFEEHPLRALGCIVLTGLLMRLAYASLFGFAMQPIQYGDSPIFFGEAISMAGGAFPQSKSWLTAFVYSIGVRLLGSHLVVLIGIDFFFDLLMVWVLYGAVKVAGSVKGGVVAAALYFLNPFFCFYTFRPYSEHFFFLFILLEFLLFVKWTQSRKCWWMLLIVALIPIIYLTKSDAGLISTVALLACIVIDVFKSGKRYTSAFLWMGCFIVVVIMTHLAIRAVNIRYHGNASVFCSSDNYWPRLFGLNYEASGTCYNNDKQLICDRYEHRTGRKIELPPNQCPEELIPLIKEEMSTRIKQMTPSKFLKLIFRKHRYAWANTLLLDSDRYKLRHATRLSKCCIFMLGIWALVVAKKDEYLVILPSLYIIGVFMMMSIAEANDRYCWIVGIFIPLVCGLVLHRGALGDSK